MNLVDIDPKSITNHKENHLYIPLNFFFQSFIGHCASWPYPPPSFLCVLALENPSGYEMFSA